MSNYLDLNDLARQIHATAVEKGWYGLDGDEDRNIGEVIALMHSELSEALEEWRNPGQPAGLIYFRTSAGGESIRWPSPDADYPKMLGKPEGFPVELADCIIRILDTCHALKIDIAEAVRIKMEYNATRSYRHGGRKA
mgnify:CR=1 FL=1